jgi:DNA-damage-inducible protein J
MPANAIVQARVDQETKDEAAIVLAAMGLTISDAVRLLLVRVARDKVLPFEPLSPNAETIAAMREARAGSLQSFSSVEALMADLNADD